MMLIVAHHAVVNSGVWGQVLEDKIASLSTYSILLFGAWGKTGINCFVLITGYFMCKSHITLKKFVKLYLQILFYDLVIGGIFFISGYETLSLKTFYHYLHGFLPVYSLTPNYFVSCFLVFWLFIPFLNILVQHLTKTQHQLLIALSLFFYTIMSIDIKYLISLDYVWWFSILYFIASYIRLYPDYFNKISSKKWGWFTVASVLLGSLSVCVFTYIWLHTDTFSFRPYYFLSDSNKIFALLIALTSFMWFKDMKIRQSRIINLLGGATFGVLLIHANSDMMRQWLWYDTLDMVGHYKELGAGMMLLYSFGCVAVIFMVCALIDICRSKLLDTWLNPKFENTVRNILNRVCVLYGRKSSRLQ